MCLLTKDIVLEGREKHCMTKIGIEEMTEFPKVTLTVIVSILDFQ